MAEIATLLAELERLHHRATDLRAREAQLADAGENDPASDTWKTADIVAASAESEFKAVLIRNYSTISRVLREAAEGWRPIETAPHGEIVLMAWKDSFLPQWSFEVGFASHGTRYPTGYSSVSQHGQATHWRPLPTPPSPEHATHSLEGDR